MATDTQICAHSVLVGAMPAKNGVNVRLGSIHEKKVSQEGRSKLTPLTAIGTAKKATIAAGVLSKANPKAVP